MSNQLGKEDSPSQGGEMIVSNMGKVSIQYEFLID